MRASGKGRRPSEGAEGGGRVRPGDRLRGARRVIGRAMRRDGFSVGRARGHECAAGHGWSECREFASWSLLFCVCVCSALEPGLESRRRFR
ncbi:hypothetical protein DIJ63_26530 [Burkholderia pseudomallei]|nr:hypothetical protein DIJ63_26530 [Burkholderia pseudomallei]